MTIAQKFKKDNPKVYDSWIELNYSILKLVEKKGIEAIIWKHFSTEKCKWWEQFAVEEEFFEAAIVYRDNVHRCFDYVEKT